MTLRPAVLVRGMMLFFLGLSLGWVSHARWSVVRVAHVPWLTCTPWLDEAQLRCRSTQGTLLRVPIGARYAFRMPALGAGPITVAVDATPFAALVVARLPASMGQRMEMIPMQAHDVRAAQVLEMVWTGETWQMLTHRGTPTLWNLWGWWS